MSLRTGANRGGMPFQVGGVGAAVLVSGALRAASRKTIMRCPVTSLRSPDGAGRVKRNDAETGIGASRKRSDTVGEFQRPSGSASRAAASPVCDPCERSLFGVPARIRQQCPVIHRASKFGSAVGAELRSQFFRPHRSGNSFARWSTRARTAGGRPRRVVNTIWTMPSRLRQSQKTRTSLPAAQA